VEVVHAFFRPDGILQALIGAELQLERGIAEPLQRHDVHSRGKRLDVDERMDREKKSLMMEALGYLFSAYSHKRRRLGPMAVLHPLRAAALLTRAQDPTPAW
jgi:hypothetical protein